MTSKVKPTVKLSGEDGNAFSIIGACSSAARRNGWSNEKIGDLRKEMMKGDYDNLLIVASNHFNVE